MAHVPDYCLSSFTIYKFYKFRFYKYLNLTVDILLNVMYSK